jgi:hypothetical protein
MYLITDKENKTFGGFLWTNETTNETDNPNHYFRLYDSLESAIYLCPFFGHKEFNVWEAEGSGECIEERTSKKFSICKTLSIKEVSLPSNEKRMLAAILCSLNIVKDQEFISWCSSYLKNEDRTKEKAFIVKESFANLEEDCERFSCAIPLLSSLSAEDRTVELTAYSIFRAISDSVDLEEKIELNKVLKIASFIPANEIASIIN